jgi:hypothetical protein
MIAAMRAATTLVACAGLALGPEIARASQEPDVQRALEAARARAAAGDAVAQFSLGSLLYYGAADVTQAIHWFRQAAAQSYPPAEFQIGQLYELGFGVTQSDAEALAWYRRAAEHGFAAAHRALGDFYRKGRGVGADAAEAARWYRRGADGDDIRAQYELGQLYFSGTGVPRDYMSAYVWFSLAAAQAPLEDNRKGLIELRDIAAARMTARQVSEAKRRVSEWRRPAGR